MTMASADQLLRGVYLGCYKCWLRRQPEAVQRKHAREEKIFQLEQQKKQIDNQSERLWAT